MVKKRDARAAYYRGLKAAMNKHIKETEDGIRSLPKVAKARKDKLLDDVRRQHAKLLRRIDRQFAYEIAAETVEGA